MTQSEMLRRSIEDHIEWRLQHTLSEVESAVTTIEISGMEEWYEAQNPTTEPLLSAKAALEAAKDHERTSAMGEDPDLNQLVNMVIGYIDAVGSMVRMGRRIMRWRKS